MNINSKRSGVSLSRHNQMYVYRKPVQVYKTENSALVPSLKQAFTVSCGDSG